MLCLEKLVGLLLKNQCKSDAYKKGLWKSQRYTVTGNRVAYSRLNSDDIWVRKKSRKLPMIPGGIYSSKSEAQPVEDDSPKALPVLGELSNSDNDINESVFIWGISDKAAQRKTISVDEGLFHLQQKKQQQQQQQQQQQPPPPPPRLEPVHRLGRGRGRLKLPHVSNIL
ncbi:unnamed protein product [Nyctereutes procyonoides]|uniref:(raccoon dog) hypothetical protein n=1 Tax=Nyctereutes procyonoides TaxID=34880 RepID=A0A811XX18_NYCPR|nr:unnamed protein product [Nyctereutes procyonoides]